MNKGVVIRLFFASFAISWAVGSGVPSEDFKAIKRAADEGLRRYLVQIPSSELEYCGLPSGLPHEKYVIGAPLQLCCILPDTLTNEGAVSTTDQLLTPTGEYYVPVLVDGTPRVVLVVGQMEGRWKTVSIGYPVIGAALASLLSDWPEAEGYHPKLVAVRQTEEFLFTVPEMNDSNLTCLPLNRASQISVAALTGCKRKPVTGLQDVLPSLKQRVKARRLNRSPMNGQGKEVAL